MSERPLGTSLSPGELLKLLVPVADPATHRIRFAHRVGATLVRVAGLGRTADLGCGQLKAIQDLGQSLLSTQGADEPLRPTNQPLHGDITGHPYWAANVPTAADERAGYPGDSLRFLLVTALIRPEEGTGLQPADLLALSRLTRPRRGAEGDVMRMAAWIGSNLQGLGERSIAGGVPYMEFPKVRPEEQLAVERAIGVLRGEGRKLRARRAGVPGSRAPVEVRRLLSPDAREHWEADELRHQRDGAAEAGVLPEELIEPRVWRGGPAFGHDEVVTTTKGEDRRAVRAEGRFYIRDNIHPGSDRALAEVEGKALTDFLYSVAEAEPQTLRGEAALSLLCMGATHISEKGTELLQFGDGQSKLTAGSVVIDPQRGLAARLIPRRDTAEEAARRSRLKALLLGPVTDKVALPLPRKLAAILQRKASFGGRGVLRHAGKQLEDARKRLIEDCGPIVGDRLTVTRIRGMLPALLIQRYGDFAATQAICGDSLGYSLASLSYFACKTSRLAEMYAAAISPVMGDCVAYKRPDSLDPYTGSAFACIKDEGIRDAISALRASVVCRPKGMWGRDALDEWISYVSQVSGYTYWMTEASSGFRPNGATAQLSVDDFLLEGMVGVVADKRVAAAMIGRLLAYPQDAIRQIEVYLQLLAGFMKWLDDHADWLKARHPKVAASLMKTVLGALDGSGPLFLERTRQGRGLQPFTVTRLPGLGPEVPRNIFRHRLNRCLRELGAHPLDVSDQMGHYFLGQPFGESSWRTAFEFEKALRLPLEKHLRNDGWKVLDCPAGLRVAKWDRYRSSDLNVAGKLKEENTRLLKSLKERRREVHEFRTANGDNIDVAFVAALKKLSVVVEDLAKPPSLRAPLTREDIDTIEAHMRATIGETGPALECCRTRLRFWLLKFKKGHGWKTAIPANMFEEPFLPDAITRWHLKAQAMVRQWRERLWLAEASSLEHLNSYRKRRGLAPAPISADLPLTTFLECLVLECGITKLDVLHSALEGLESLSRTKSYPEILTLPLKVKIVKPALDTEGAHGSEDAQGKKDEKECSLLLTGKPAAAALAAKAVLESRRHAASTNGVRQSGQPIVPLPRLFAGYLDGKKAGRRASFAVIAEIVEMALRVERAGPIPFTSLSRGACSLPVARLHAVMLNSSARPREDAAGKEPAERPLGNCDKPNDEASAYDRLQATLYTIGRLDSSGRAQLVDGLKCLETELDSQQGDALAGQPNVQILSAYARFLLERAKRSQRRVFAVQPTSGQGSDAIGAAKLKLATVYSYVSRIGSELLRQLAGQSLRHLESDEVEEVYRAVIFNKPETAQKDTLDRLREFHAFARRTFGVAAVTFAEIYEDLPEVTELCEASIVTEAEYQLAVEQVEAWIRRADARTRYLFRAVKLALHIMYRCGLRMGEVRRLRYADVARFEGRLYLHVRTNQFGQVKTAAGRRFLEFRTSVDAERLELMKWINEEGATHDVRERPQRPIFADIENRLETIRQSFLQTHLKSLLQLATGDRNARPHWLRHSFASGLVGQGEVLGLTTPAGERTQVHGRVRALWIAAQMGHAQLRTTLSTYYHLHDMRQMPLQLAALPMERGAAARLFRISTQTWRVGRSRRPVLTTPSGAVAYFIRRIKAVEPARSSKISSWVPNLRAVAKTGVDDMVSFICDAADGMSWRQIERSYGIDHGEADGLISCISKAQEEAQCWIVSPDTIAQYAQVVGGQAKGSRFVQTPKGRAQKVQRKALLDVARKVTPARVAMSDSDHIDKLLQNYAARASKFDPTVLAAAGQTLQRLGIDPDQAAARHVWITLVGVRMAQFRKSKSADKVIKKAGKVIKKASRTNLLTSQAGPRMVKPPMVVNEFPWDEVF